MTVIDQISLNTSSSRNGTAANLTQNTAQSKAIQQLGIHLSAHLSDSKNG
jgi:hypothetical protein